MIWVDVDTALASIPVNAMPLTDDTDFKSIKNSVAYNASGMTLSWFFVTTAGVMTKTAVTPTTSGTYDWGNLGNGFYTLEMPASGGGSANNDTEGFGWFSGVATGVLPWTGPIIGFRHAALNNSLVDAGSTGLLAPATAGRTLVVDASGLADANTVKVGPTGSGTAQTAGDIIGDTNDIQARIPAALGANGNIKADVRDFNGTAATAASGRPEVNTSHIAGSAVSASSAQIGVNVVNLGGSAVDASSGLINANVKQISTDATAADNAESFFDGTGYAGTNNVIPTVTTLTNAPSDSSGVTTLLSRLSALRAGYLDNLSAGAVATASALTTAAADITSILGKFTGITLLAQWLGLIAGKQTGNSTARTELRATGAGSGTFDETTDSQEAVRDRGDAAWADSGTPPTAAAIATQVRTELTTELGRVDAAITTRLAASTTGSGFSAIPWNASWDTEVQSEVQDALDAVLADSIPADGTRPSVSQALYMLTQFMVERSVSGTTVTVKKADGSTTLFTLTISDATSPTSITRTT